MNSPIKKTVRILANEFQSADSTAEVIEEDQLNNRMLLKLDSKVELGNDVCAFAVAKPRNTRNTIDLRVSGEILSCNLIWVPESQFDKGDPMNTSWWRGGGAVIADVIAE